MSDDFEEFEVTPEQFDRMLAEAEDAELVAHPDQRRSDNGILVADIAYSSIFADNRTEPYVGVAVEG